MKDKDNNTTNDFDILFMGEYVKNNLSTKHQEYQDGFNDCLSLIAKVIESIKYN